MDIRKQLPIYVVNMDQDKVRLDAISRQLKWLGLDWERITAIDASLTDADVLTEHFGTTPNSAPIPATLGDMACTLSHWNFLKNFADSTQEYAIILEDDAVLSEEFREFALGGWLPEIKESSLDLLRLEYWPAGPSSRHYLLGRELFEKNRTTLYHLRSSAFGSCAYLIGREAAQSLTKKFPKPLMPIDHVLSGERAAMGFSMFRIGFLNPAPVLHNVFGHFSRIRDERAQSGIAQHEKTIRSILARRHMRHRHQIIRWLGRADWIRITCSFDETPYSEQ